MIDQLTGAGGRFLSTLRAIGVSIILTTVAGRTDTLSVYFPPALGADIGLTTSTGTSLAGFTVLAGTLSVTPDQLFSNLSGKNTAAQVRSTVDSAFTSFGSFLMSDAYLSDPDQGVILLDGDMASGAIRNRDIYLIFYNAADKNAATEMSILRMADRSQSTGQGVGIFPNAAFLGVRNADFYLGDGNGILPAQDALQLLIGGFDPVQNRFVLGSIEGGIGRIISQTNLTIPPGIAQDYLIQANHGADRYATTNLPAWASLATNGVIRLNPPADSGSTNFIGLLASNSVTGKSASATLRLVVQASSLTFTTTTNLIQGHAGVALENFTFVSTGTGPTYSVASGNLRGLSLSGSGILSGIPTSPGTNDVTIRASAGGGSATTTFSLAIANPTLVVPAGELSDGQIVATAGSMRTVVLSNTPGFINRSGSITSPNPTPTGVSFDGTNLVVATNAQPLARGTANLTLTLTANRVVGGSTVSASTTVPLRVVAPVPTSLVGTNEFEVDVGQAFSTSILTDAGSFARMSFSNLPPGLSGFSSGLISGVNRNSGLPNVYPVSVIASTTNLYEGGGVLTSTITVRLRNTNPPFFSPLTNRILGALGKNISLVLNASNFPYAYGASNLPTGLSLVGNTISGIPAEAGLFPIPVVAYNSYRPGSTNPADRQPGFGTVVISVANVKPPSSVAPTNPGVLTKNATISLNDNRLLLDAVSSGVMVSAIGLPPGISLDPTTGKIYGTPTATGTFQVTVFIQNGKGWIRKGVSLTVR